MNFLTISENVKEIGKERNLGNKTTSEGEVETTLAELWADVLTLDKISVTHSFLDLGGDSLKAVRVLARIFQHFGSEVKLPDLYPHGSVRSLAEVLQGGIRSSPPESESMRPTMNSAELEVGRA